MRIEQARPEPAPNAWWREFDKALGWALDHHHSCRYAEDFAVAQAEAAHPGGRDA